MSDRDALSEYTAAWDRMKAANDALREAKQEVLRCARTVNDSPQGGTKIDIGVTLGMMREQYRG